MEVAAARSWAFVGLGVEIGRLMVFGFVGGGGAGAGGTSAFGLEGVAAL